MVIPEKLRGYSENGRKWEREEKGPVRLVKTVKRWEGEKIISEKLKSKKTSKTVKGHVKCESTKKKTIISLWIFFIINHIINHQSEGIQ